MLQQFAEAIVEIENLAEEEHGYLTMRRDTVELKKAIDRWMFDSADELEAGNVTYKVIRSATRKWNGEKLRKLVPKAIWLKITDQTPNSDKIEEAVKSGKLDYKQIEAAFEETPRAPYVKQARKEESGEVDELRSKLGG